MDKPIIFNTDMVKAILDGRKTQTRRVIKPQPHIERGVMRWQKPHKGGMHNIDLNMDDHADLAYPFCPYGQVGDRLWVKETHKFTAFGFALNAYIEYKDGEKKDVTTYIKDGTTVYNQDQPDVHKWRPSIHMPRWASRITLEITEVRVERVQEINLLDCLKEGIDKMMWSAAYNGYRTKLAPRLINDFHELWDSLNAKRGYGWDSNCWVWVISFKE